MDLLLFSWPSLILLGLGVRMALRMTYGARGPEPDDPVYLLLNVTGWALIGLGLAPAALVGLFTIFGAIIVILAAVTLIDALFQRRAAQRRSTCTLLSLVADQGTKLDASVLMAGQSMQGVVGRSAGHLFQDLQQGTPLLAAVKNNPGALPREARAFLAAGGSADAHRAALRELSRSEESEMAVIWRACIDRLAYLFTVMLVMSTVLTFVMISIVPEFENIFTDFELDLPATTQMAIWLSAWAVNYLPALIALVFFSIILAAIAVAICHISGFRVFDWLADRMFRGRRTSDVLRMLAVATEQRRPLGETMLPISLAHPSPSVRRRMTKASNAVGAGGDWCEALSDVRMITQQEGGLLKSAQRAGNLPWALRTIAARRERRDVYRLATALQVIYPLAILGLGAMVAFYVISMFLPLVNLIYGMS